MASSHIEEQIQQLLRINKEEQEKVQQEKKAHELTVQQLRENTRLLQEQKKQNYRLSEQIGKVEVQMKNVSDSISGFEDEIERLKSRLNALKDVLNKKDTCFREERNRANLRTRELFLQIQDLTKKYSPEAVIKQMKSARSRIEHLKRVKSCQTKEDIEDPEELELKKQREELRTRNESLFKQVDSVRTALQNRQRRQSVEEVRLKQLEISTLQGLIQESKTKIEEYLQSSKMIDGQLHEMIEETATKYADVACKFCSQQALTIEMLNGMSDEDSALIIQHQQAQLEAYDQSEADQMMQEAEQ